MFPLSPLRVSLLLPLLPLLLCLLLTVGVSHGAPNPVSDEPVFTPQPEPRPDYLKKDVNPAKDVLYDFDPAEDDDRYVGYCVEKYVRMTPGRSRKFWSYGYVYLEEAYPSNCTLKYTFTTKSNPADTYEKYGYRVTGTFVGPNVNFASCSETDYITIDDTEGTSETYCGTSATIDFTTGSNYIEFSFTSQEDSPGALGFFVTIESYYTCGGLITSATHGPSGEITSPSYPSTYPANSNCVWWFTALEESTIKVECSTFQLADHIVFDNGTSYCPDYLSFSYEAVTPDDTSFYCNGDMDSRTIYSAGNDLLITFRSDYNDNNYSGFTCTYDFIMFAV